MVEKFYLFFHVSHFFVTWFEMYSVQSFYVCFFVLNKFYSNPWWTSNAVEFKNNYNSGSNWLKPVGKLLCERARAFSSWWVRNTTTTTTKDTLWVQRKKKTKHEKSKLKFIYFNQMKKERHKKQHKIWAVKIAIHLDCIVDIFRQPDHSPSIESTHSINMWLKWLLRN